MRVPKPVKRKSAHASTRFNSRLRLFEIGNHCRSDPRIVSTTADFDGPVKAGSARGISSDESGGWSIAGARWWVSLKCSSAGTSSGPSARSASSAESALLTSCLSRDSAAAS